MDFWDLRQGEPPNSLLEGGSGIPGLPTSEPRKSAKGGDQGSLGERTNPASSLLRGLGSQRTPGPASLAWREAGSHGPCAPRPSASSTASLRNPDTAWRPPGPRDFKLGADPRFPDARTHLGGHHALSLSDQVALLALAVPPHAEALVALERRRVAVVPASRALGQPRGLLAPGARA